MIDQTSLINTPVHNPFDPNSHGNQILIKPILFVRVFLDLNSSPDRSERRLVSIRVQEWRGAHLTFLCSTMPYIMFAAITFVTRDPSLYTGCQSTCLDILAAR